MRWIAQSTGLFSQGRHAGPAVVRYGFAFLAAALAYLLTVLFGPLVERSLFLFFFAAVAASAWFGGLGPGLVTTIVAVASANTFIPPPDRWETGPGDLLVLSVFGVAAVILSALSESRRIARYRAEEEATRARELARRLQEQTTELQRRSDTQQFLLETARLLASSLDLEATLRQVTSIIVPTFADYCLIHLVAEDGSFRPVAAVHVEQEKSLWVEELGRVYRPEPRSRDPIVSQAWQTGTPVLVPDARHALDSILQDQATQSLAVLPLIVRGTALGAISLATSSSGRRYDDDDIAFRELLELFGARVAIALDNALLLTEVRRAHERDLRSSQLEAQLVQARLEALRSQLNPHFLFNALNTIAMLVRRKASSQAIQGIVGLSQILRQVLRRRSTPEVRLGEELALVENYLTIEQLRFGDRLGVTVSVTPEVLDARVPSLLLQPLVENAVRHGIGRRSEAGRIEIVGSRQNGSLRLEVCDNGPGFPDGWELNSSRGIGLANTRERLQRLYGDTYAFTSRNGPQGGAVVSVTIPFRTEEAA